MSTRPSISITYEKWLNGYVEQPAQEAFEKVADERALTRRELEHLVRYAFAQSVRTPKDYIAYQEKASDIVPGLLSDSLKRATRQKASLLLLHQWRHPWTKRSR